MNSQELKWMSKYRFSEFGSEFVGEAVAIYSDSVTLNVLRPAGHKCFHHIRTTTILYTQLELIGEYIGETVAAPSQKMLDWDTIIAKLEKKFAAIRKDQQKLLNQNIKLNDHTIIKNVSRMVNSHLSVVKKNKGNPVFIPYIDRLIQLSKII